MTPPAVSLLSHKTYDPEATLEAVRKVLAPLGGMERFVKPGMTVLLKPNLVAGQPPEKAVNTHPAVARAAALLAKEAGAAKILIGDSPGYGSAKSVMKTCGLAEMAEEAGAEMIEFTSAASVDEDRQFVRLELAKELFDADLVVNLPKMKTHGQMLMTLAVKNMFGASVGTRKLQWHYRAGRDRMVFARALNEIAEAATPALTIMDAVVGMDGTGPTSGRARPAGFVAASDNMWSLDAVVMDILGVDRRELFTLAEKASRDPGAWQTPSLAGDAPETLRPEDWRFPELSTLQMHGGTIEKYLPFLGRWLRGKVTPLPVANELCVGCGYCVKICPGKAMRLENRKVVVNDRDCIRCYCCHELCPSHGLRIQGVGLVHWLFSLGRR